MKNKTKLNDKAWDKWKTKGRFVELEESARQVKEWNRYGKGIKIDWCPVLLVVLILGVVIAILV